MNSISSSFKTLWVKFSKLPRWVQIASVVVLITVVVGIVVLLHGKTNNAADNTLPTVTLQSLSSFGAGSDSVDVLGTVQSVSEADLLAQSGGNVESVNTTLGANVPAGFVIANLDSSSASAAVLQAQGAYDAAVAAEQATSLQSQNSTNSVSVEETTVQNTYQSTYSTLDSTLATDINDIFFGAPGPFGPDLVLSPLTTGNTIPQEHQQVLALLDTWHTSLATDTTTDPLTLLANAQSTLNTTSSFLSDLSALADQNGSNATPSQLASLAAARASVNSLLANISSVQTAYNASVTSAAVGQTQSSGANGNSSGDAVTSSQAQVEEALGGLRSAQAAYEKTVVRAPIAGTINYLSIHVGDYVTANQHVATVAHDDSLEVVMFLSQDERNRLAVGDTLNIIGEDASGNPTTSQGVVTTIAPALDPTTQEIEVDVAANTGSTLVDGQSVQVALPTPTPAMVSAEESSSAAAGTSAQSSGSDVGDTSSTTAAIDVPITAVKLLPNERDLFTVDSTGHLVAHAVTIGNVVGNDIQILTALDPSLEIVTDARGLSAGDMVLVASSTPATASGS